MLEARKMKHTDIDRKGNVIGPPFAQHMLSPEELAFFEELKAHALPNSLAKCDNPVLVAAAKIGYKAFGPSGNTTDLRTFIQTLSKLGMTPTDADSVTDALKEETLTVYDNLDAAVPEVVEQVPAHQAPERIDALADLIPPPPKEVPPPEVVEEVVAPPVIPEPAPAPEKSDAEKKYDEKMGVMDAEEEENFQW